MAKTIVKKEEETEKWNLIGKIKRNIIESLGGFKAPVQEKIKVFIIEDSPTQIMIYRSAIESSKDIKISAVAVSGEEGVEVFKKFEKKPDIILMDISMPGMNGIEATGKIKTIDPSAKIIILSAMEIDRDTVLKAFKAGAIGYMIKKTSLENIREAIRKAYSGGSPIEPDVATVLLDEIVNKKQTPIDSDEESQEEFDIEDVDLVELLIELCSEKITGKITINSSIEKGELFLKKGKIIHCTYGKLNGEDAFYQIINWSSGMGRFYSEELPENITIETETDKLLSELITRKNQFNKIKEIVKSENDIFRLHLDNNSAIVKLQSGQLYILTHLDEKKSVMDIIKETGKTYFDVAKDIYELYLSGLVKKVE